MQIAASSIGRGCRIGKGVTIEGSYLHEDVTVWEGAVIKAAMLCEGVTIMPHAQILPGTVISFKVQCPTSKPRPSSMSATILVSLFDSCINALVVPIMS